MKIAVSALGQDMNAPTGLLSFYSQLARLLPQVDARNEYHFLVTERSRGIVGAGAGSHTGVIALAPGGIYGRLVTEHFQLGPWLARNGFDVLFMANAGVSPLVLPPALALVQAVYGFHQFNKGELSPLKSFYRKILFDHSMRRADAVILNSAFSQTLLEKHGHVGAEKVHIIPHGVNEKLFHDRPLTDEENGALHALGIPPRYAAFVSQIYPYKNVDVAVEGFCRFVSRSGADHGLLLVGQFSSTFGEGEKFRQTLIGIAAEHGLANRLMFRERVPGKALRAIYRGADFYIQSSTSETFGRTTLEAMACGCPVVAARAAATPEVLGDAGLYYDGRDVEECAEALSRLHQDNALRQAGVVRGLEEAARRTASAEAFALATVFQQAAENRRKRTLR